MNDLFQDPRNLGRHSPSGDAPLRHAAFSATTSAEWFDGGFESLEQGSRLVLIPSELVVIQPRGRILLPSEDPWYLENGSPKWSNVSDMEGEIGDMLSKLGVRAGGGRLELEEHIVDSVRDFVATAKLRGANRFEFDVRRKNGEPGAPGLWHMDKHDTREPLGVTMTETLVVECDSDENAENGAAFAPDIFIDRPRIIRLYEERKAPEIIHTTIEALLAEHLQGSAPPTISPGKIGMFWTGTAEGLCHRAARHDENPDQYHRLLLVGRAWFDYRQAA